MNPGNMELKNIVDNHCHLSPQGRGLEAVKDFQSEGGTHIFCPNLTSKSYEVVVERREDYRDIFKKHISFLESIEAEVEVEIFPVLGVHPAEVSRFKGSISIKKAERKVEKGLEIATEFIEQGKAVALGEIGRPHYNAPKKVVDACNRLMEKGFSLAAELDCAVQLHTEKLKRESIKNISLLANKKGLPRKKIVHHFAPPLIDVFEEYGSIPSIVSRKNFLEKSVEKGTRFLMETDYLDDPTRPGAVLGPKTVPRRSKKLLVEKKLSLEDLRHIHKDIPEDVYGLKF